MKPYRSSGIMITCCTQFQLGPFLITTFCNQSWRCKLSPTFSGIIMTIKNVHHKCQTAADLLNNFSFGILVAKVAKPNKLIIFHWLATNTVILLSSSVHILVIRGVTSIENALRQIPRTGSHEVLFASPKTSKMAAP